MREYYSITKYNTVNGHLMTWGNKSHYSKGKKSFKCYVKKDITEKKTTMDRKEYNSK